MNSDKKLEMEDPHKMTDGSSCNRCGVVHLDKVLVNQCRLLWALERPKRYKRVESEIEERLVHVLGNLDTVHVNTDLNNNIDRIGTKINNSSQIENKTKNKCNEALQKYLQTLTVNKSEDEEIVRKVKTEDEDIFGDFQTVSYENLNISYVELNDDCCENSLTCLHEEEIKPTKKENKKWDILFESYISDDEGNPSRGSTDMIQKSPAVQFSEEVESYIKPENNLGVALHSCLKTSFKVNIKGRNDAEKGKENITSAQVVAWKDDLDSTISTDVDTSSDVEQFYSFDEDEEEPVRTDRRPWWFSRLFKF